MLVHAKTDLGFSEVTMVMETGQDLQLSSTFGKVTYYEVFPLCKFLENVSEDKAKKLLERRIQLIIRKGFDIYSWLEAMSGRKWKKIKKN